jgi:hypothetical protein
LFDAVPLEWLLTLAGLAGALAAPFGASALQSLVEQRARRRTTAIVSRAFQPSLGSRSGDDVRSLDDVRGREGQRRESGDEAEATRESERRRADEG